MGTDRIEKRIVLKAPTDRVWRAIGDAKEFGTWFGAELDGPFVQGRRLKCRIVPTKVDPEVAKMQKPHEGMQFEVYVERVEAPRELAFRWHPFAIDKNVDYSKEPTTLVAFRLEKAPGGTQLTITESGFDSIPLSRREQAFKANEGGWQKQTELIAKYLEMFP